MRRKWRASVVVAVIVLGLIVVFYLGSVGNTMHNPRPEQYLRMLSRADATPPCSLAIVEFDDQGELWDPDQLQTAVEHIADLSSSSPDGVVLLTFIHGWKQDASEVWGEESRLLWLEEMLRHIASTENSSRPVIGLFIGWRGSTQRFPFLEDVTFWNRRVAAHRVASIGLTEVLVRCLYAAKLNPESKSVLIGHSMGGLILEKTMGPIIVSMVLDAARTQEPVPVDIDLIVMANPSITALSSKKLVDFLDRNHTELVLLGPGDSVHPAEGPLLASITSELDTVIAYPFPFSMWVNSIFLRYRDYPDPGVPSQRSLGIHGAGREPYLFSHEVDVRNDEIFLDEYEGRFNRTPFWIMQVPKEVSGDHSDIGGPLWRKLLVQLMARNQIFEPDVQLAITVTQ